MRHAALQVVAVARRRLLTRRQFWIPNSTLTRRRKMSRRHLVGMLIRLVISNDDSGATADGKEDKSQDKA